MKLILTENVENLGMMGQTVEVKPGYARNFLLPRKLAVPATPKNLKAQTAVLATIEKKASRLAADAAALGGRLSGVCLVFRRKAGENGRLFGSVTNMDVAEALAEKGFAIDRKDIVIEPVKELGEYAAVVRLHQDVAPAVKVTVEAEPAE
jgi:large subunit ribosomal protein L9